METGRLGCHGSKGGGRSLYAKLPNKGVMVPPFGGLEVIILELFHPILWLIWLACSDKAELSFFTKKDFFLVRLYSRTKLTFDLSDKTFVVCARDGISRVGPCKFLLS